MKSGYGMKACWLLLLLICVSLSGCMFASPDSLYSLPQQSLAYEKLQETLNEYITDSVTYCAPISGDNRQPIQMQDLNGDGKNEAIVFAKGQGDFPLKIFIFARGADDSFSLASTLEGEGNSFESVSYAQIDGAPGLNLIVGLSLNELMPKSLGVYALDGNLTMKLLSANYKSYVLFDMDSDGRTDLFLFRHDSETGENLGELYCYSEGTMKKSAELSLPAGTLKKLSAGNFSENNPALFVSVLAEDGTVKTNAYAVRENTLSCVVAETTGYGNYASYVTDIDGDGFTEMPRLIDYSAGQNSTSYQLLEWYRQDGQGNQKNAAFTYHDYATGFYFILRPEWKNRFTVITDETVNHGTGYYLAEKYDNQDGNYIFAIYLYNGTDRKQLSEADGRFLLGELNDVCISVKPGKGKLAADLTEDELRSAFHLIYSDWTN